MNHRGAMAVEYALVLPVVLLFILGIADCGRLLWTYATLYTLTLREPERIACQSESSGFC